MLGDTVQSRLLRECSLLTLTAHTNADTHPLPATADREGYYGEEDNLAYWLMGLGDYLFFQGLIETCLPPSAHGRQPRVLEFGCASARALRHFAIQGKLAPCYGCDINRNNVAFIRNHLPESIIACQNTEIPPLPFEDGSFDFVYALSVFTHISDFEEAWLLELARVIRPGGILFVTYHSERTWQTMASPHHFLTEYLSSAPHEVEFLDTQVAPFDRSLFARPMPSERVVFIRKDYPVNNTNVFCTTDYIKRRWGRIFQIEKLFSRVHGEHQDGVVLRKG